ncbi:hypothetical protein [Bifidobacterium pullorum]|uniref:hypothetical protein n=1 Tax=Bifidobacterium pullorum TaxID=78448 RepID=UPI000529F776|nr:hypothetical protein [Bifidobacterium pullorum]
MSSTTSLFPGTPVPSEGLQAAGLQGLSVATITPFASAACPCRQAVEDSRAALRNSALLSEQAALAVAALHMQAEGLDWTGNAATMFRQRLGELDGEARLFDTDARETWRLSLTETS